MDDTRCQPYLSQSAERRPDRGGTVAVGAVVHLLATAIEEGRDLSSMSGIRVDTA
ncbi:hypothetical protein GCM10010174_47250 [Kutzneria viridogrisea]|uniref:Uncharacterized protein n=1 Tax=Kutzneria viridogrisea TaxID=47990 RepID=A0ABR6B9Q8_9PSEU|nr:hypothetical protein [Kutzneria viridogrisea]